jgi:hypothetical protein
LAEARAAAEQKTMYEDSLDEEDEEEFAEIEQPEPEPDQIIGINIGGRPAKTAGLEMEDLIRQGDVIKMARYVSPEDGVIHQFCRSASLRWETNSLY